MDVEVVAVVMVVRVLEDVVMIVSVVEVVVEVTLAIVVPDIVVMKMELEVVAVSIVEALVVELAVDEPELVEALIVVELAVVKPELVETLIVVELSVAVVDETGRLEDAKLEDAGDVERELVVTLGCFVPHLRLAAPDVTKEARTTA